MKRVAKPLTVLPSKGLPNVALDVNSFCPYFCAGATSMTPRKTNHAVLYLRSSKDRSDVSIDAQRRELMALASQRVLVVAEEYADAVESGGTKIARIPLHGRRNARRPRKWTAVMTLDTSRLSREPS